MGQKLDAVLASIPDAPQKKSSVADVLASIPGAEPKVSKLDAALAAIPDAEVATSIADLQSPVATGAVDLAPLVVPPSKSPVRLQQRSIDYRPPDVLDRVVPTALRTVPAVVGGVVGTLADPFVGPAGTMAGGAIGSAGGEYLAQKYEKSHGQRRDTNLGQVAAAGAFGAIPVFGKAKTVLRGVLNRGAQGALASGGQNVATELIEGRTPTVGGTATAAALGAAMGGGAGAVEGRIASRALASRAAAEAAQEAAPPRVVTARATKKDGTKWELVEGKWEPAQAETFPTTAQPPAAGEIRDAVPAPGQNRAIRQANTMGAKIPPTKPLRKESIASDENLVLRMPKHQQDDFRQIFDENNHFPEHRRGEQSWERTKAIADWVKVDRKNVLARGTTMNDAELNAYANHLATSREKVSELSDLIRQGKGSPELLAEHAKAVLETTVLTANLSGAKTETARALNALKIMARLGRVKNGEAYDQLVKMSREYGHDLTKIAKDFGNITDPVAQLKYLRGLQKTTLMDWVKGTFFSGILSGPATHGANILGNTSRYAFGSLVQPAALGVDVTRNLGSRALHMLTGGKVGVRQREYFAGEAFARAHGSIVGFKKGLDDAFFTLTKGMNRSDLGTFDLPRKELPGGGFNPMNYPGRLLESADQLFYGINYQAELHQRLFARASKAGLTGKARTKQINEWVMAPPPEVEKAAVRDATRAVFKDQEGSLVQLASYAKKIAPWLDFVVPFTRTPMNIIRQGVEATPLFAITGQSREALKAGGRDSAEAIGRAAAGTAGLATIAWWFGTGGLSGTGPSDARERASLMENGWQPNSVKIGDHWVPFANLSQPLAQPLFAMANTFDLFRREGKQADPLHVLAMVGKSVLDQSFLTGLSDMNNALSDPDRYADQFLSRYAQSFVPFSGLLRNTAQAVDPTVRQPGSIPEAIKTIIPGASKSVPARLGRFGQEVERPHGAVVRGYSPIKPGHPSDDPVTQQLTRLNITNISLPPKDLQATERYPAIELSVDERKAIGVAQRTAIERLLPRLQSLPPGSQQARDLVRRAVQAAREQATNQVRQERARRSTR